MYFNHNITSHHRSSWSTYCRLWNNWLFIYILILENPLQLTVVPITMQSNLSNILQRALPKKVGQSIPLHRYTVYEIKVTTRLPGVSDMIHFILSPF